MSAFIVRDDSQKILAGRNILKEAIAQAAFFLSGTLEGKPASFVVEDAEGHAVAVLTNRRIEGSFTKQAWGGRKDNDAIFVGSEQFDATDAVLLMPHAELMELEDNQDSTDSLGREHVNWDGPCEVTVVSSVCEYFGVETLRGITAEALAFARERAAPERATVETITLAVQVTVRILPGANRHRETFVDSLSCSITSSIEGNLVLGADVISHS